MTAVRRLRLFSMSATLAVVVVIAAGCQVRTDVDLRVDRDGSGTVAVTVDLDREAAAQVPALGTQLRVTDLRRAGWRLVGPTRTAGGGLRVIATKRFGRPEQASAVLAELAGQSGPFGALAVTRSQGFAKTTWAARGTVDLRRGLAAFSDQRLSVLLGGKPFGRSEQELRLLAHGSLADAAPFRLRVHLPGAATRTYVLRLGSPPVPIDSVARETSTRAYAFIALAVLAVVAALVVFVLGGRARRRPRRAQRGMGAYDRRRFEPLDPDDGPAPGTGGSPQLVRVRRPPPSRPPNRGPGDGGRGRARPTRPDDPPRPRPRRPPDP